MKNVLAVAISITAILCLIAIPHVRGAAPAQSSAEAAAAAAQGRPAAGRQAPFQDTEMTKLVIAFYGALLQEGAPTLEQENALFNPKPGLQARLVRSGQGTVRDALFLNYFRKHKDWFIPKNMKSQSEISVSNEISWRNLTKIGNPPEIGTATVWVCFAKDSAAKPLVASLVLFNFIKGKIEVDNIRLEGPGSSPTLGKFLQEFPMPGEEGLFPKAATQDAKPMQ